MSLSSDVKKIFEENTNYTSPGQAINQARSLDALSGDLYTDSKRFSYELLQNADDSHIDNKPVMVWVKILDEYLVLAHSGKPFSSRDLRGICNVDDGTKKSDPKQTGYKGIGFKSVFGQSEQVTIFTNGEYFRFDSSYSFEWKWEKSKEMWEKENDRYFQFPWQIIPIFTEEQEVPKTINQYLESTGAKVATIVQLKNHKETIEAIQSLATNVNMFLFLRNVSKIEFDIESPVSVKIDRNDQNKIFLSKNEELKTTWLIKTIGLKVPASLKKSLHDERNIPEKLLNADVIELSMAAEIGQDGIKKLSSQDKLLYSYLPTDERRYSFPVLANTSFLTTANRESLHADSKWNQWLFNTIAKEIFKWISELVSSEFEYQAYKLIPEKTVTDSLGKAFNSGVEEALKSIPFVITNDKEIVKIEDVIVDFTFLSEKDFIGGDTIKNFINQGENNKEKFAANTGYGPVFKKLGATSFEWNDVFKLLKTQSLSDFLSIEKNIKLIKYLKILCESEKQSEVTVEFLKKLSFIRDHKSILNTPSDVCFPAPDDPNWNDPNSALSFIHPGLKKWLSKDGQLRLWLETLGMVEKTDITYIHQTLIPNIEDYVTFENAIQTLQDIFILNKKYPKEIEKLFKPLSRIKLLTQKGSLKPANECYLSDFYSPRLEIEKVLELDIFVSKKYCSDKVDKDEWKRFFKLLGVNLGISILIESEQKSTTRLTQLGYDNDYFEADDKKFRPFLSTFTGDAYLNISSLSFLQFTITNSKFAISFWSDFIQNYSPDQIKSPATTYWGNPGKPSRISGDEVENYIPWFIKNQDCIPTVTGECKKSGSVLLNTEEFKLLSGKYLPVFNGPELTPDWKSFFEFRTNLELSDYLDLLYSISLDTDNDHRIKNENYKRIQTVYACLLDLCPNWSSSDISYVEEWSRKGSLLNTKSQFSEGSEIKYFIDGNDSIFQGQFHFLSLNADNRKHQNLESLLQYFNVTILRQSDFELIPEEEETCLSLTERLRVIIPYLKIWIKHESTSDSETEVMDYLQGEVDKLKIFQAKSLKISYANIDFRKNVNVHFDQANLFVTNPWNTNSVLLKLPEVLTRYFTLRGHEKKLDFLLRSSNGEILEYFAQENIELPDELNNVTIEGENKLSYEGEISSEYFHSPGRNFEWIEKRIPEAVEKVLNYLNTLSEYDCTNSYQIAPSIIGGITKNGNEIAVVARPSDDNKVLIHYDSEFDVLQYVDAEFWGEDGINPPIKITLGQLLRETRIDRIPIRQSDLTPTDLELLVDNPNSEEFDFNAVPYAPEKIAKIISSFANSNGGTLIFGMRETSPSTNEIVGLSNDFRMVEIMRKAISLLSPIPKVEFNWLISGEKSVFVIETEKSDDDILLNGQKYIREKTQSLLEVNESYQRKVLNVPNFKKTIAIIIAIENYKPRAENQISRVKYANNDALSFKKVMMESMQVLEDDIVMYTDEMALKSDLEYGFSGLFHSLTEDDRLIFYYVGHGFHNGMANFLSTYDMHQYNISATAISLNKLLLDPLRKSKCKTALIFIDACAKTFHDENERNQITNLNEEELILLSNEFPYYATFLSCQPGQSSYSSDILKNGIFTHHLINALNGNVVEALNGKYVTDRLLNDYLSKSVSEFAKTEQGKDQNPRAILDSSGENVIVDINGTPKK